MLEQLGLSGPQPECDSNVSTEEYDEPAAAPLPQAGNVTNVSGAPEQEANGAKRFKDKVDELAKRLPLPVDPEISWDAVVSVASLCSNDGLFLAQRSNPNASRQPKYIWGKPRIRHLTNPYTYRTPY